MGKTLAEKIISEHLVKGTMIPGEEIAIRIDQTLTQDATGTMAYLQFEALGIDRVKTRLSMSYVDHNTLQNGFENADDHRFLQTFSRKYGLYYSKAGNGICHQVHLERFAKPGETLLGADSHTPTAGGMGMLAIGAGGLDIATAMAGEPFYLRMPTIVKVELVGRLAPWVSAKDIILEVLRRLTVKGGVGKIIEYCGEGLQYLSVPERATITNMGAELGATSSIFPSDEMTRLYLKAQGREQDWVPLAADADAVYGEELTIRLDELVPMVACPHSPDAVRPVAELGEIKVDQVVIGSCTNSSYKDLMQAAAILRGKKIHPDVSLVVAPGSRQVLKMLADNGALSDFIMAGARILECACGPCVGVGQAPATGAVSVRTINRNFEGRSGTKSAQVYLAGPEVAAAAALAGKLIDPRSLGEYEVIPQPTKFVIDDSMILPPAPEGEEVEIIRGPNIKPLPLNEPLPQEIKAPVILKVGDNITTDHIVPAGSKVLPLRSNIPAISEYTFSGIDPSFAARAKAAGKGFIVGGENYGQGSSREHAALAPMYLGIKAVLAKSFARIHRSNLINMGILPLTFEDAKDYDLIGQEDELQLVELREQISQGNKVVVKNLSKDVEITMRHHLSERELALVLAGGLLNYVRNAQKE
ncbi:MAG: aconitate hydratase [Clostridia bacterium]|nr:aconitate hydratase [Clostridia bacterium]